jgi:hypothetical protein
LGSSHAASYRGRRVTAPVPGCVPPDRQGR